MHHDHETMVDSEHSTKEVAKFVAVLLGIVVVASLWNLSVQSPDFSSWLRIFMGVFLVVFASFKFAGYRMFVEMFMGYDVIAKRSKFCAAAYPFIELILGIFYLADLIPTVRDVITIVVFAIGTIGVAQEIQKRSGIHCACLGNIIRLPLSTVSLVEDVGMVAMGLYMLLA